LGCSLDQIYLINTVVIKYTELNSLNRWASPSQAQLGRAMTILALGNLNSDNGLPGFGDPPQYQSLNSGDALNALVSERQFFKGHSGGWGLVLSWGQSPSSQSS